MVDHGGVDPAIILAAEQVETITSLDDVVGPQLSPINNTGLFTEQSPSELCLLYIQSLYMYNTKTTCLLMVSLDVSRETVLTASTGERCRITRHFPLLQRKNLGGREK